jgi:hypothetical protein
MVVLSSKLLSSKLIKAAWRSPAGVPRLHLRSRETVALLAAPGVKSSFLFTNTYFLNKSMMFYVIHNLSHKRKENACLCFAVPLCT